MTTDPDNAERRTTLLIELEDRPGALESALRPFARHGVNLTHIESRPRHGPTFDFHVDCEGRRGDPALDRTIADLSRTTVHVMVLDDKEVPWFPRHIAELDLVANNTLDAGGALQADHPGFSDQKLPPTSHRDRPFGAALSTRPTVPGRRLHRRRDRDLGARLPTTRTASPTVRLRGVPDGVSRPGGALRIQPRSRSRGACGQRLPRSADRLRAAARTGPPATERLSQRVGLPGVFRDTVRTPPLRAVLHPGARRLPRTTRPRAHVRRSRLRRPVARDRARKPRCQRRGHRALGRLLLVLGGIRAVAGKRPVEGLRRRGAVQRRRARARLRRRSARRGVQAVGSGGRRAPKTIRLPSSSRATGSRTRCRTPRRECGTSASRSQGRSTPATTPPRNASGSTALSDDDIDRRYLFSTDSPVVPTSKGA